MPRGQGFSSKSQLRTCYSKKLSAEAQGKKSSWDCDKSLQETPDPNCLPERVDGTQHLKCRTMRKEEKITSKVYEGSKGGLYFYAAGVKVYVPKDRQTHDYVVEKYKLTLETKRSPNKSLKRSPTKSPRRVATKSPLRAKSPRKLAT
jgi:hypothetical protein